MQITLLILALCLIAYLGWHKKPTYTGRGEMLRYERNQTAASETEAWRWGR